ncbi:hypothetical protein ABZW96_18405 [Nocardia sp. NPDC004168]|uniref:hypothetical protein n=1 Tax=Nocardia sp. NPDC004168 TaxID=3154452 RepID=UPI0033A048D6
MPGWLVSGKRVQTVYYVRQFGGVVAVPAASSARLYPMQCRGQLFQGGRRIQWFVVERQNFSAQLADGGMRSGIVARRDVGLPGQILDGERGVRRAPDEWRKP